MEYCIGEACKLRLQARLATATAVVLHSDARKHRLTLRYRCVTGSLKATKGYLGHTSLSLVKTENLESADSVAAAVKRIFQDACTKYLNPS